MFSAWGLTDRGVIRKENQDSCAYEVMENGEAWGVVCDGMGGAKAGDVASQMAVATFRDYMAQLTQNKKRSEEGALLVQAAEVANEAIYRKAETDLNCFGMGTTLVGMILKNNFVWVINVGDSRAYHITKDAIERITRDHSVVQDWVDQGKLTPDEARRHPRKNLITRALGTARTVKTDLFQRSVAEGDTILLCSDGLVNEVTDQEICREVKTGGTPQEICQRLMEKTLVSGAPDNVTIVLFQL